MILFIKQKCFKIYPGSTVSQGQNVQQQQVPHQLQTSLSL